MIRKIILLVSLGVFIVGLNLFSSTIKALNAPLVEEAIEVDGVLDELVWQDALIIQDFKSIRPNTQEDGPYATQVKIITTQEGLYVGAINEQPEGTLIAKSTSRDISPAADRFLIVLDTSGAGKYGFHFETSLGNSISDGIVQAERDFEYSWDGAFESKSSAIGNGWVVETFIPWNILRMPENGDTQTIGMYFHRHISHLNQFVAWPSIPFTDQTYLSALEKIEVPKVDQGSNIAIAPYVSANYDQLESESDFKAGADVFWQPNANWQIASTFNPDFGQVENDTIVVNFSANETFLPEKRPFFVENKDIFEVPGAPRLVYTRRIGASQDDPDIANDREIIASEATPDIINATKVIGEQGALRFGIMAAMEDKAKFRLDNGETVSVDGSDFYAARFLYEDLTEKGNRWGIGYFGTTTDHFDSSADVNQVDTLFRSSDGSFLFDAQWLTSDTIEGTGSGARAMLSYTDDFGLVHRLRVLDYDKKLDINDAGFLYRNDLEQYFYRLAHYNEDSDNFRSLKHELRVFYQRNKDGFWLDTNLWYVGNFKFNNLQWIDWVMGVDRDDYVDDMDDDNQIFKTRNKPNFRLTYGTDTSRALAQEYTVRFFTEDLGGQGKQVAANYTWTPSSEFYITGGILYRESKDRIIHVEDDRFDGYNSETIDFNLKGTWAIGSSQELRLGVQWLAVDNEGTASYRINDNRHLEDSNEDALATSFSFSDFNLQLRYKYEFAPLSDLYIVYGEAGDIDFEDNEFQGSARSLLSRARDNTNTRNWVVKVRYRF